MKQLEEMKQMATRRFNLILIFVILFLLGLSFVLAASRDSQENFCIKLPESYLTGGCEIGCCVDGNGFEHSNYPRQLCEDRKGRFYRGECKNLFVCN